MKKRFMFSVVIILVAIVGVVSLKGRRTGDERQPAADASPLTKTPLGTIPYYLQNDPRWGADTIGGSGESLAAAGCTVTCVALGLTALGHAMTPAEACAGLKRQAGFTADGLIIWEKVGELTSGAVQVSVAQLDMKIVDAELDFGHPVIAKILLTQTVAHWVLLVGKEGGDYLAMDPLNQEHTLVELPAGDIHAIRVFGSS
ncbi:MAG: hypothetical protein ACYC6A_03630 [Armatimonadota bacterium]